MRATSIGLALLLTLAGACLPAKTYAQDFSAGLDAYNAGDYARARANWWPLAVQGNAKAQASLGFLYYGGLGVPRDDQQSLLWFGRAAEAGQPTAQFFLGLHYFYGKGVKRDFAIAHAWCDIAMANGYLDSLGCRDAAALEMNDADRARSDRLTDEFFRTHAFRN